MGKAVCLISGGMDSCVAAAEADHYGLELAFFHANYGQRTEYRELLAFHKIADHYGVRQRLIADLTVLAEIGGSALTDPGQPLPEGQLVRDEVPTSYVPFRNGLILAAAAAWAEVVSAQYLYAGAVEVDGSGYPDCRRCFFDAFQKAVEEGTRAETRIEIRTPLLEMRKSQVVTRGLALQAPLEHTWSCYRTSDQACGRCDSCLVRLRGFQEAGHPDPVPYHQPQRATAV